VLFTQIYYYLISIRLFNKEKFAEATIMYEQHIFGIFKFKCRHITGIKLI